MRISATMIPIEQNVFTPVMNQSSPLENIISPPTPSSPVSLPASPSSTPSTAETTDEDLHNILRGNDNSANQGTFF
jgi:hypothetical protein